MRRISASRLYAGLTALLLAGAGCDGGGAEEGVPKDLTPAVPLNSISVDMKPKTAPGEAKGAEAKPAATLEVK